MDIQSEARNYHELAEKYISALKECKENERLIEKKAEIKRRENALAKRAHCLMAVYKEVCRLPHNLQGSIEENYSVFNNIGIVNFSIKKDLDINQHYLCHVPMHGFWIEIPEGENTIYVTKDEPIRINSAALPSKTLPAEIVLSDEEMLSMIQIIENEIGEFETNFYADVDRVVENIQINNKNNNPDNREVL